MNADRKREKRGSFTSFDGREENGGFKSLPREKEKGVVL